MEAYILAGGKSSRMGEDKGLKLLNNQPMIQYIINSLQPIFSTLKIISGNETYKKFGFPVLKDTIIKKGPMGGIYTALQNTKEPQVFIISCDVPFVTTQQIKKLIEILPKDKSLVTSFNEKIHPLCGFYHKNSLPEIEKHIEENKLKMMDLLQKIPTKIIKIQTDILQNINTLKDFKQAENQLKS